MKKSNRDTFFRTTDVDSSGSLTKNELHIKLLKYFKVNEQDNDLMRSIFDAVVDIRGRIRNSFEENFSKKLNSRKYFSSRISVVYFR